MNEFWQTILGQLGGVLLQAAIPVIVTIVVALMSLLGKFILNKIKESQTTLDDRLAAMAVAWAEDNIGGGKGDEKLSAACDKLEEMTKGRIKSDRAETIIRAAYQALYGQLKPLKNG